MESRKHNIVKARVVARNELAAAVVILQLTPEMHKHNNCVFVDAEVYNA